MESLKEIRLYGKLGQKFGRIHRLAVSTCGEAIRALSSQLDGFDEFMRDAKKNGLTFATFIGDENITFDQIPRGIGERPFRIAPVIIGSKTAGLFQTIMGAALIVAGVLLTIYSGGTGAAVGEYMIGAGISMMAGGVIQMLSPQTTANSISEDSANTASYAFGGPVNTTAQGNVVGVLYGKREIGGAIISGGIIANEIRN